MSSGKGLDKFLQINELARRRGFFWQSFEIYGGVGGFVTYGPLGTRLKLNIESTIREIFVKKLGVLEIESSIITPGKVFEASGHDVDTVIVDGKILMENRKVKTVNEAKILEKAQEEAEKMVETAGVKPFMGIHEKMWRHSRY